MMSLTLTFFRDVLAAGGRSALARACPRVLYVRSGSISVRTDAGVAALAPNSAWHGSGACEALAGNVGAEVYRWELLAQPDPAATLQAGIELDDAAGWLVRCDRVDFPPGGIAYTHTHRGPGIRCLLQGEIRVNAAGKEHRLKPGEAWFEAGPDPVLAHASERQPTSFARVMILPAELRGKSSIRYVLPEDQDKPKRQTYQLFIDEVCNIHSPQGGR